MQKLKLLFILFIAFLGLFYVAEIYLTKRPKAAVLKHVVNLPQNQDSIKADNDLRKSSQDFFEQVLLPSNFNGGILVIRKDKIIYENYAGLEKIDSGKPIDSLTAFHLASVSKTFTGMAILKLWEKDSLQLDDPVKMYLDDFPYPKITIRNLLSHRSGLPNYVHFIETLGWDKRRFVSNNDVLQLLKANSNKLKHGKPDTYFEYCNTNYVLLALIIEKVTNVSFPEFIDNEIFKPLGMVNSFTFKLEMEEKVLPSFTSKNKEEPIMFLDAVYGDKNIYSTTRDLMKWDHALGSGHFFSKKVLEEAFKGNSYESKGSHNYGLGWRLIENPQGKKIVYHNGWWHGNNTVFRRLPDDSVAIIVLGNKFNRSIYQADNIANVFKGYDIQPDQQD